MSKDWAILVPSGLCPPPELRDRGQPPHCCHEEPQSVSQPIRGLFVCVSLYQSWLLWRFPRLSLCVCVLDKECLFQAQGKKALRCSLAEAPGSWLRLKLL